MRTMMPKLVGISLARDADDKPEIAAGARLNPRDGILDDNRPSRFNPKQLGCHQEGIRGGLPGKLLRFDRVAVDPDIEEGIKFGGRQNGIAVLTRGDDGGLESETAELMNELNASRVSRDPCLGNGLVDQVVLAVAKPAHRFGLRRVMRASFGELQAARCEKIANAVEAGLPIDIEAVVCLEIERTKDITGLS